MKRMLVISMVMALIISGCSMMHDDRSGCERIVPRISSYINGELFGLYIVDGNNVVVVANERVTTFDQNVHTDRELHHKDEYTYFLYSPYSYNPKGMPEVEDVVDTRNPNEFFSGLVTSPEENLRVSRGEYVSYGPCVIYFRMTPIELY